MAPMHTEPMEQELKDITTVQKHVRMQKVSPVEVVIACLKRIEQLNPELNAFITLPCGCDSNGLPLGLQMVGKPWDEATVLGLAYRDETTTSWKNKHPAA